MVADRSRRAFAPLLILMIAVVGSAVVWAQRTALPDSAVVAAAAGGAPAGGETGVSAVRLLVGRSTILDVGTPIARVSLTSPDVADALVTTATQLLINGKTPGTISMFVWDRAGGVRRYEVMVQRDLERLSGQLKELFPGEDIRVQSSGRALVLSGAASSKDAIDKAVNLAAGYVEKKDEVVSLLQIRSGAPSNQVLLHVRFAEVSRTALTELGVSFFTSPLGIKNTIGSITTQQFPSADFSDLAAQKKDVTEFGSRVTSASGKITFSDFLNLFLFNEKYDLGALVRALQSRGLFQSLAEPNLVAESGKEASFLAGGEIPVPVPQASGGGVAITVQYKEFGIRLNFTPVVAGDRIHLKVRPEVSTLDFANAVLLQGFRIPAFSTRRAETELELRDHQTFAIAGLLNNTMNKTLQKVPGIGDIPILGLLFRSEAAQKDRTELVVMITPEILPNDSSGVTPNLPRLQEPYLPPLAPKKSHEPPPPAFQPPSPPPAAAPGSPAAAAAAVSALTPGAPKVVPVKERDASAERTGSPAAAAAARPLTREEQQRFERARKLEREKAAAEARARAEREAKAAKQAEADRREAAKKAAKERERQDKLAREQAERDARAAREQAKRDAEAAKRAAEEAKKQAERDRERQKALDAAAERLRQAQLAYQAELARTGKSKEKQP